MKELNVDDSDRIESMQATNPRYILRNWIAQVTDTSSKKGVFHLKEYGHFQSRVVMKRI